MGLLYLYRTGSSTKQTDGFWRENSWFLYSYDGHKQMELSVDGFMQKTKLCFIVGHNFGLSG
jgi:hypothetical protein